MQSALRKMGNSTGLIVPRTLLAEIGAKIGVTMDLKVENGKLVATPVTATPRAGWSAAAEAVSADETAIEWQGFTNEDDAELKW